MSTPRPRIALVGTGGTIAGAHQPGGGTAYRAGVLSLPDLVATVPRLGERIDLVLDPFCTLDSVDMDLPVQLDLARRVAGLLEADDIDAVVVTHGTDTVEETAYLLHLVVPSRKPLVVVGAMRPSDALSADGPANLATAVEVAAAAESRGRGCVVVIGGEIHSARQVAKRHTSRPNAFGSTLTPLGEIVGGSPRYYAQPTRRFGASGAFDLASLPDALPPVEVLLSHPSMPREVVAAMVTSGARGIVHVGPGNGSVPSRVVRQLTEATRAGVVVVRCSRVGAGVVERNGAVDDTALGWVAGDDLTPHKARVLLALALTTTSDPAGIQDLFDTH